MVGAGSLPVNKIVHCLAPHEIALDSRLEPSTHGSKLIEA